MSNAVGHKPPPGAQVNWSHPLARGLVTWWQLSEGAGAPTDLATGELGTLGGMISTQPSWSASPWGPAMQFSAGAYVRQADSNRLDVGQITTFEAMVFVNAFPGSGQQYLSDFWADDGSQATAVWRIGSGGTSGNAARLGLTFNDGSFRDTAASVDLVAQQWTHVVVTTDGQNVRFYYDGRLVTTNAYTYTPTQKATIWQMGAWSFSSSNNARSLDGRIAWLRRWNNRALTQPEISLLIGNPHAMLHPAWPWRIVPQASGPQALTASLLTNTSTFYGPTVTPGAVALTAPLIASTTTFYGPTVAPGSVAVVAPLLPNSTTFYAPTVTSVVALVAPLLTNTSAFYGPTVTPGAVTLTVGLLTNTPVFYAAVITGGAVVVTAPAAVTLADMAACLVALSDAAACVVTLEDSAA